MDTIKATVTINLTIPVDELKASVPYNTIKASIGDNPLDIAKATLVDDLNPSRDDLGAVTSRWMDNVGVKVEPMPVDLFKQAKDSTTLVDMDQTCLAFAEPIDNDTWMAWAGAVPPSDYDKPLAIELDDSLLDGEYVNLIASGDSVCVNYSLDGDKQVLRSLTLPTGFSMPTTNGDSSPSHRANVTTLVGILYSLSYADLVACVNYLRSNGVGPMPTSFRLLGFEFINHDA